MSLFVILFMHARALAAVIGVIGVNRLELHTLDNQSLRRLGVVI